MDSWLRLSLLARLMSPSFYHIRGRSARKINVIMHDMAVVGPPPQYSTKDLQYKVKYYLKSFRFESWLVTIFFGSAWRISMLLCAVD